MTPGDEATRDGAGSWPTRRAGVRVVLGGVVVCLLMVLAVLLGSGPGPLDQPDAARQRDGLVLDGPTAEPTVAGVHLRSLPNVLLFVRDPPDAAVLDDWRRSLPPVARVSVVVQGSRPTEDAREVSPAGTVGQVSSVQDPEGRLAAAVGLPQSIDGGPGIGYAVVDAQGVVRYSTLDPAWADNAFELATILGATS